MKKLILSCMFVTVAAGSFAQSQKVTQKTTTTTTTTTTGKNTQATIVATPEKIAERRANYYKTNLGLTDAQYKAVYDAELDNVKQDQQVRATGGQPGPGQTMQMNMARDQRFKAALTADQYSKYEATQNKAK